MSFRNLLTVIHRYTGLGIASFLIVVGITGSVIAFAGELDRALNPNWFTVEPKGKQMPASKMVIQVQDHFKNARVEHIALPKLPEDAAILSLTSKRGADPIVDDQVFLNPYTGDIIGQRVWGELGLDRARIIPFLYKLHYSLHLNKTGILLLGVVSLIWFFDCFVGIYLALPRYTWRSIKSSLSVKWNSGPARFNFDVHRATGLWIWLILAMLAFTGVAMNLSTEVFRPAVEIFSNFSQWPESNYIPQGDPEDKFKVTIDAAIKVADEYLEKEGISAKLGAIGFNHGKGTYRIRYHSSADLMDQHPDTQIFVSGQTAEVFGRRIPGYGTTGDIISEWQYPLHSGKAFGFAGRVLICLSGIGVTVLSITGVIIWGRKRARRLKVT